MCGRFTLRTPSNLLVEHFLLDGPLQLALRFNIAPTQEIPVVLPPAEGPLRACRMMRWGLIPWWSKDDKGAARLINARSESVAQRPAFRAAFQGRRCLIPADGYFEWVADGKRKQPFLIRRPDDGLMGFAGLWETWRGDDQPPVCSCTIITTDANEQTRSVHDRMPVIIAPEQYDFWLTADATQDRDALLELLAPYHGSEPLRLDPVNPRVNNVRNDDPACIEVQQSLF